MCLKNNEQHGCTEPRSAKICLRAHGRVAFPPPPVALQLACVPPTAPFRSVGRAIAHHQLPLGSSLMQLLLLLFFNDINTP
jgi:hypothetical protein